MLHCLHSAYNSESAFSHAKLGADFAASGMPAIAHNLKTQKCAESRRMDRQWLLFESAEENRDKTNRRQTIAVNEEKHIQWQAGHAIS